MIEQDTLRHIQPGLGRLLTIVFMVAMLPCFTCSDATAQLRPQGRHYLYDYEMAPGEIAQRKILARQSMVGYFQPIELKGPKGSQIDVFSEGSFQATTQQMTMAGMMVGHIYRLKITNIPGHPGKELYPSVEIIGRLFPPTGRETEFPIPVNLHIDDLTPALNGALVTRVVYLENPRTAIAEQREKHDQPFFDVGVNEDPIRVAERLGRPMAILRIGSRIPDNDELNAFGFGTPPMIWFDSASVRQYTTPAQMDPMNIQPFESNPFDMEDLPPGFDVEGDNETGIRRDHSVRQVAYFEPVSEPMQEIQEEVAPAKPAFSPQDTPPPVPWSGGNVTVPEVAQDWSLGDKGVQNNTGLTPDGMVQEVIDVDEPAVPEILSPGDAFNDPFGTEFFTQELPPVPFGGHPNEMFAEAAPMFNLPPWPDELLIDGGDRSLAALVKDEGDSWKVHGLETEDTIAHFDTLDGRRIVDASNRVAIYAPRFAAVRKIDNLGRTQYTNQIARMNEGISPSSSQGMAFSSTAKQNLQPQRHQRMTQPVGIENQTRGLRIENGVSIKIFDGRFKAYENLRLMKTGYMDNREKGRLSIAIARAMTWESDLAAQSSTRNLRVTVAADVREAQEAVHVKTEFNRPQLRLVKIASVDTAHPGDYVEFTIRFDNVGDQPIGNVTVLDNLTGRLAYEKETAECTLPGKFIEEPNKAGSKILRWEITDPLPAGKGGVIRFRCRVR